MAVGYIVGGLCTVRYLTALPPRVLLMGQQVLSCCFTQNNDRSDFTSHWGDMQKPPNCNSQAFLHCTAIRARATSSSGPSPAPGNVAADQPTQLQRDYRGRSVDTVFAVWRHLTAPNMVSSEDPDQVMSIFDYSAAR